MRLRAIYVRFYRAFNFDFLRTQGPGYRPDPWDEMGDGPALYPYVQIDVDDEVTCIVGANESGKSQLLTAVECALGGKAPTPADFCRYSTLFTVADAMKLPHFGLRFGDLSDEESAVIVELAKLDKATTVETFRVFRTRAGQVSLYVNDLAPQEIDDLTALEEVLPTVFRIDPMRAIPNSVPIAFVAGGGRRGGVDPGPSRHDRWSLLDPVVDRSSSVFSQLGQMEQLLATLSELFGGIPTPGTRGEKEEKDYQAELDLAYDLLVTVGGIHNSAFVELQSALRNDDEGLANGIVSRMNDQLAGSLNLTRWWSQDQRFNVALAVHDYDIVFTIRDRTGSEYSFAERSGGLQFFLSYLVQFLAHINSRDGSEVLLMDEPDAYLSNQGQQDLLRIFQEFTRPHGSGASGQVVFVTHSPFLIDKNRADRVRVLDKGSGSEGTRVVRDVGHNHFEPLRTALGGFVGETAFIGNCNLMLEGMSDQIYLAGMSSLLKRKGAATTECLDLNKITLVPAGSASHVPYMTYLARGRDADKPAVLVLLDGDKDGDDAVKVLKQGGPRRKQLLRPDYVVQLKRDVIPGVVSERPEGHFVMEDLVPVEVGLAAAKRYLAEMEMDEPSSFPSVKNVRDLLSRTLGVHGAIQKALADAGSELRLEKLGFARHVVAIAEDDLHPGVDALRDRFKALFSHLSAKQRAAEREREGESIRDRVDREKSRFLKAHETLAPTKAEVSVLLERVETLVDQDVEGDALLTAIRRIQEEFELSSNLTDPIGDQAALLARVESLQYAELLASQPEPSTS